MGVLPCVYAKEITSDMRQIDGKKKEKKEKQGGPSWKLLMKPMSNQEDKNNVHTMKSKSSWAATDHLIYRDFSVGGHELIRCGTLPWLISIVMVTTAEGLINPSV